MDLHFVILAFCLVGTVYSSSEVKRFLGRVHGDNQITCDQNSTIVTKYPFLCTGEKTCTSSFDNIYYGCLKDDFQKSKCKEMGRETLISESGCYYGREENQIQLTFPKNHLGTFHFFVLHEHIEYSDEEKNRIMDEAFAYHKCCHDCEYTCDKIKVGGRSWILVIVSNHTDEDFEDFFQDLPKEKIMDETPTLGVIDYLNSAKGPTKITCDQNSIVVTNGSDVCNEKQSCEVSKDVHFVCLRKRYLTSGCDELTRDTIIDQDGCYVSNEQYRFELLFPKISNKYFHVFVLRTSIEFPNAEQAREYRPAFHYYTCNRNGKYDCDNVKVDGKSWILTIASDNEKESFGEFFTEFPRNSTLDTKEPRSLGVIKYLNSAKAPAKISCDQNSIVVTNDSDVCNEKQSCEVSKDVHFVCLRNRYRKSNCDELARDTTIDQDGCYASNGGFKFELIFPKNSSKYFHVFVLRTSIEFPNAEQVREYRPAFHYYTCNRNGKYDCDNVKVDGKSWILTIVSDNEIEDFGKFLTEPSRKSFTDSQKTPGVVRYLNVAEAPTKITCDQNSIVVTNDSDVCNEKRSCDFSKDVPFVCLRKRFRKSNCDELTRDTTINQNGCYVSNEQYKFELRFPENSDKYFHVFVLRTSIEFPHPKRITYRPAFFYFRCNRKWDSDCENVKVDGKSWILTIVSDKRDEDFGEFFTDFTPSTTEEETSEPHGLLKYLKRASSPTRITCDENSIVVADGPKDCNEERSCFFSKDVLFICLRKRFQTSNCYKLTSDTIIQPDRCYVGDEDSKFKLNYPKDVDTYYHIFVLRSSIEFPNLKAYRTAFFYYVCCRTCNHDCENVYVDGKSWILTLASSKKAEDFGEFFTEPPPQLKDAENEKKESQIGVKRYLGMAKAPTTIICEENSIVVTNDTNNCNEKRSCQFSENVPLVCLRRRYQRSNCYKLTRDTIIQPDRCYVSNEDSKFKLNYPKDPNTNYHVFVLRTSIEYPSLQKGTEYRSAFFYYVCCRTCNHDCENVYVDGKSWILTLASDKKDEDFGEFFTELPRGSPKKEKSKRKIKDFLKIAAAQSTVSCDQNTYVVSNDPDACHGTQSCRFSELRPYLCLRREFEKSNCMELGSGTVIDQSGCYVGKESGKIDLNFPRYSSKFFNVLVLHNSIDFPNPDHTDAHHSAFHRYQCCRRCSYNCDGVTVDGNSWILVTVSDEQEENFEDFFVDVTAEPEPESESGEPPKLGDFFRLANGMALIGCSNHSSIVTDEPHACAGSKICYKRMKNIVFTCLKNIFKEEKCRDLTKYSPIRQSGCYVGKEEDEFIIPFSKSSAALYHIFVLRKSVEYKNVLGQVIKRPAFDYVRCVYPCEFTVDGDTWILVKASSNVEENFGDFFEVPRLAKLGRP